MKGRADQAPRVDADEALDIVHSSMDVWLASGPSSAAAAMATGIELILAARQWQSIIDRNLRDLDLNFSRYELLMRLIFNEARSCSVAELGALLQVHPTSASNSVERLETSGYVRVDRSRRDGRRLEVSLTRRGREAAAAGSDRLNHEVFTRIPLPGAEVNKLVWLLARFRANSGDF